MRTYLLAAAAAAVATFAAAPVLAQTVVQEHTTVVKKNSGGAGAGAAGGAVAGAVVAGPVGAVIGGVAGAVAGNSIAPPTEVRTYVVEQNVAAVPYTHEVVVGKTIDGDIAWLEVPSYPKYRWAYLGGKRVVVEADTRRVVAIY